MGLIQEGLGGLRRPRETKAQPQTETPRKDGFEPFVNPEPKRNQLFVNSYNGNFAQQMDLNREGIEKVLKIAHLDGQIILDSFNPLRQRSIEANPDGSITEKRSLLFGENIEEDQKENPFRRVIPFSRGWRIEINDTKVREGLEKRNPIRKKLQKEFIREFNGQLKQGMWECIWREKLSSVKNKYIRRKLFLTLFPPLIQPLLQLLVFSQNADMIALITFTTVFIFPSYGFMNLVQKEFRSISTLPRKIDHPLEYFMPQVEIDKVLRSGTFLTRKGRTLVKEVKSKNK